MSRLKTAQHEAAHVVVGLALDMKLAKAEVTTALTGQVVWYPEGDDRNAAWAVMYAAGPAVDGIDHPQCQHDVACAESCGVDIVTASRCARAILETRARIWSQVTRLLHDQGRITARDLEGIRLPNSSP